VRPVSGPDPAPAAPRARPRWRRRLLRGAAALVALAALAGGALVVRLGPIGAGFTAKQLASAVFVSGREPDEVLASDLAPDELSALLHLCASEVDRERGRVRARFLGLFEREAVHRPGRGVTLAIEAPAPLPAPSPRPAPAAPDALWPEGERVALDALPAGVDGARLEAALDAAFAEPDPERPRRTRAVVVVWRGRILAERYADGFTAETPQHGWSMTKTVVAALVGVLVREGRWALDAPVPVPEWPEGDPRAAITLEQLLQMRSGLEFDESYSPLTDVTEMLFAASDAGAYAAAKPLAHPPGEVWSYSSGTTNLLCRAMAETLGPAYPDFPRAALFGPLGMRSALVEVDAAGHFVGSSFGWATPRDWARFGLLWVEDGVWAGERILPDGWVDDATRPAPGSGGAYGAHLWLRLRADSAAEDALPDDAFHAAGHDGQLLTMIPSRELVVVRLGLTRARRAWDQAALLGDVLAALPSGG